MDLDLIALHCFVVVAERGSFSRAAEQLYRSQSAVSQQIAKLERQISKPLFLRGQQLRLTAEGELLLGYARRLLALQEEACLRLTESDVEGEVHFGLPEDFASVLLAPVLADFVKSHPKVVLHIRTGLTLDLLEQFKQGAFDLVLVKLSRTEDFPHGVEVWSEQLRWAGTPSLVKPSGAEPLPLVLGPRPCVYRERALTALEGSNQRWRLVLSSPNYAATTAAVKEGLGITVLPESMIPEGLRALNEEWLPPLPDIHVSLLHSDHAMQAVESLETFVLRQLQD